MPELFAIHKNKRMPVKQINIADGGFVEFQNGEQIGIEFVTFEELPERKAEWEAITHQKNART